MAKCKIVLKKVTKIDPKWNNLKGQLNVKFSEKSGWYLFNGVSEDGKMFCLLDRKGEEFRTNQIFVRYYA